MVEHHIGDTIDQPRGIVDFDVAFVNIPAHFLTDSFIAGFKPELFQEVIDRDFDFISHPLVEIVLCPANGFDVGLEWGVGQGLETTGFTTAGYHRRTILHMSRFKLILGDFVTDSLLFLLADNLQSFLLIVAQILNRNAAAKAAFFLALIELAPMMQPIEAMPVMAEGR